MQIHLPQLNKTLTCNKGENLFQVLKGNNIAIASSCNGDGICCKCAVSVDWEQKAPPTTELEKRGMDKFTLPHHQRLSCQITVDQNIEVQTSYW